MYPNAPIQNGQYVPQQNAAPMVPAQTQQMNVAPQQQQQQFAGQQQQQIPQPQYQQVPAQPAPQQPMMPLVAPNPNMPAQAPAQPAHQQQQNQQPAASPYEPIYQDLARRTGHPVETFRQSIKDNPAIMSAMLGEAIDGIRQAESTRQQIPAVQPQQQQAQQRTDGKIDIPQAAMQMLRQNPQSGTFEAVDPAYQQFANAANHNRLIDQSRAQQFMTDPSSLFKDQQFKSVMQQEVDRQVRERMAVEQVQALRSTVRAKYAKEIAFTDPTTGQVMINPQDIGKPDPRPLLTPLGTAFMDIANSMAAQGMRETQDLYDRAMILAKSQLGMIGQPQQQGQVQQQPQQQAGLFGQQNMQQAQQPGIQNQMMPVQQMPMAQPNLSELMQQQMNANSFWPGQAPARNPSVPSNMPLEGALMLALQNMPEGGNMDSYFSALGPSLFN